MPIIRNFDSLATTPERKIVLELIETGLSSVQPSEEVSKRVTVNGELLTVNENQYDLSQYERVHLIGFGKGSGGISKILEQTLGDKLTDGYVIDVHEETFEKIHFTLGTHPVPSETNYEFTKTVLEKFSHLTEKDLVIVVICGGGSALLVAPQDTTTLDEKISVNKDLLKCGANIHEMNIVRKHLSKVKGGNLAKTLHPAKIVSLIFSDVPGNDLNTIASGPTVKDPYTVEDAWKVIQKYHMDQDLAHIKEKLVETPKDDAIFENVDNILFVSNDTALAAMQKKAEELGWNATIYSNKFEGEARDVGKKLIDACPNGEILLAGGETTVTVHGHGKGGRNQELVLGTYNILTEGTVISSFGTDGHDNSDMCGAIADTDTFEKAKELNLDPQIYLNDNNSFEFWTKEGDGIDTGILPSNVSDLMIVLKARANSGSWLSQDDEKNKAVIPAEAEIQDATQTVMESKMSRSQTITNLSHEDLTMLEEKAVEAREHVIDMLLEAGSGHSAGPLGMADIFVDFYFHILNHDPKNPDWEDRDRLILSNGHICPIRYAVMAMAGYFPIEELKTLRKLNSRLQGHPHRTALPGVETTSGPLGEGLSQGVGMALAAKMDKKKQRIYVLTSDGEHEEGNTWEAAMMAGKYKLDNLTAVMDRNNIQIDGWTEDVMPLEGLRYKYESFNWKVIETDGHNHEMFINAVAQAQATHQQPTMIIAHTIPGKGVDFMENDYTWHGKPPNKEEAKKALDELRTLQGKIVSEHQ